MPITIPNVEKVKPTMEFTSIPNAMKTGTKNPCPLRVAPVGAASSGNGLLEPTVDPLAVGYVGYNVRSNATIGGAYEDEAYACVRNTIVDGFAGVVPGSNVYVDPTARPDPESTFSGLTHTNTGGTARRIGVGFTTTKICFD